MAGARRTILVVDDDAAVRDSLRWLLESAEFDVETFDSSDALLAFDKLGEAAALVLDVRMPGMGGLAIQQELRRRGIEFPIIVITGHADVSMAIQAMKAGAADFIEKPFCDDALLASIRGELARDSRRRAQADRQREARARLADLTRREHQVLDLIVAGLANKEISDELDVTISTVEAHRSSIRRKTRADKLADLVRLVLEAEG